MLVLVVKTLNFSKPFSFNTMPFLFFSKHELEDTFLPEVGTLECSLVAAIMYQQQFNCKQKSVVLKLNILFIKM